MAYYSSLGGLKVARLDRDTSLGEVIAPVGVDGGCS